MSAVKRRMAPQRQCQSRTAGDRSLIEEEMRLRRCLRRNGIAKGITSASASASNAIEAAGRLAGVHTDHGKGYGCAG